MPMWIGTYESHSLDRDEVVVHMCFDALARCCLWDSRMDFISC